MSSFREAEEQEEADYNRRLNENLRKINLTNRIKKLEEKINRKH